MDLAVDVIVRFGVLALFWRNEDPAVDAWRLGCYKVAFAPYKVTAHKGVQACFQQFVHHPLGLAFVAFLLGNGNPVAGQDFLHLFRRQEHIPAFIQCYKAETPVGGFDSAGKHHLVFFNIGLQLAQLGEGVGV